MCNRIVHSLEALDYAKRGPFFPLKIAEPKNRKKEFHTWPPPEQSAIIDLSVLKAA